MMRILVILFFLLTCDPAAIAETSLNGYWEGVIANSGREMRFNVEFTGDAGKLTARTDIPEQYIFDYQLANVRYEYPKIHFELPLGQQPEHFEGTINAQNISGKYSGRFYKDEIRSAAFFLWREKREVRYTREEVSFRNGQVELAGTLFMPRKKARHPAIALFHGSGPQTRESYLRYFADLFAQRGFATLIYDKRGTGKSTGEIWYRTGDNFDNLVGDALAGVQFLLGRNDVDSRRIGLWGLSQGGWLAPIAATRSKNVAFLIAVSGGGVTPAQQELYDDEVKLRDRSFSEDQIAEAVSLLKMADNVIRKVVSWEEFEAARERARTKPWFALLDRYPVKLPKGDPTWQSGSAQMDFDPAPVWEKIKVPVLAIFGAADKSTPSRESAQKIEAALKRGGNHHYRIEIFAAADHGLWVSSGKERWDWDRPAPGWLETLTNWLKDR